MPQKQGGSQLTNTWENGDDINNESSESPEDTDSDDSSKEGSDNDASGENDSGRRAALHVPRSFFSEDERAILRGYIEDYKKGTRQERQQLVKRLSKELKEKGNLNNIPTIRRKIEKYMTSKNRTLERLLPWKKPSLKSVFVYRYDSDIRNIILEKYGLVPGDSAFIGKHAKEVKLFMENLSTEQMDELRQLQADWKSTGPPPEKRRKVAEKSLDNLILRFSQKLYWETGARIVVLAGYRTPDSRMRYGAYDYNSYVGSGKTGFSTFFPGYSKSEMLQRFQDYLQENLTDDEENDNNRSVVGKPTRKNRPLPQLDTNQWNEPMLGDSFRQLEDIDERRTTIRAWITGFYNLAAGTISSPVPWSAMISDPGEYIDLDCWPPQISVKDPSKLRKEELQTAFDFWMARQKNLKVPAFQFHHVRAPGRNSAPIQSLDWRRLKSQGKGKATPSKMEAKKKGKQSRKGAANCNGSDEGKSKSKRTKLTGLKEEDDFVGEVTPPAEGDTEAGKHSADRDIDTDDSLTPSPTKDDTYHPQKSNREEQPRSWDLANETTLAPPSQPHRSTSEVEVVPSVDPRASVMSTNTSAQPLVQTHISAPIQAPVPVGGIPLLPPEMLHQALGVITHLLGIANASSAVDPPIDPTLSGIPGNMLIGQRGYPTNGPNDPTPTGCYPLPSNMVPTPAVQPSVYDQTPVSNTGSRPVPTFSKDDRKKREPVPTTSSKDDRKKRDREELPGDEHPKKKRKRKSSVPESEHKSESNRHDAQQKHRKKHQDSALLAHGSESRQQQQAKSDRKPKVVGIPSKRDANSASAAMRNSQSRTSTKAEPEEANIPTEGAANQLSANRLRPDNLRPSPSKRRFENYEAHSEFSKLDGLDTKRPRVTPRPLFSGERGSNKRSDVKAEESDSDSLFIKKTFR